MPRPLEPTTTGGILMIGFPPSMQFILLPALFFYVGYIRTLNSDLSLGCTPTPDNSDTIQSRGPQTNKVGTATSCFPSPEWLKVIVESRVESDIQNIQFPISNASKYEALFPTTTKNYAAGALRVSSREFFGAYDLGVPLAREIREESNEAIILYHTEAAFPSDVDLRQAAIHGDVRNEAKNNQDNGKSENEISNWSIAETSVSTALQNCDTLNIIQTSIKDRAFSHECYLMINDHHNHSLPNYHINRYVRLPIFNDNDDAVPRRLDRAKPLRHSSRLATTFELGFEDFSVPRDGQIRKHWESLSVFLENVDRVLEELGEVLKRRKSGLRGGESDGRNTVVVMTVNRGQRELFANFICSAKRRNINTDNILVFPTDEDTVEFIERFGVLTFLDKSNLGGLPRGEAEFFGDDTFGAMMLAKVLCVLYVNLLGYDVLYCDVDLIFFQDPIPYIHNFTDPTNPATQHFDVLFQRDGNDMPRYNPFSANTGFYFIRSNEKTHYLLISQLYHGDCIRTTRNDQDCMASLIVEHNSLFGLNVKSLDEGLFPGGAEFHTNWPIMRKIFSGDLKPYIFHMSWTNGKKNKLLFLKQLGEWYVKDECIANDIPKPVDGGTSGSDDLVNTCCLAQPVYSCHYKDKPSKLPCPDGAMIDERGTVFWQE